ncbi:MAG: hypothetical protein M1818_004207 [Claussenomyces sp. TS43310]|nr:MAG: hypothetical protein M1818_004207 [Claussenomyces sp. TS43310]
MPHVGIIGAGISGLRCASTLLSHGCRVTVLEGRDRVGGRMHQMLLPGTTHLVDVGPNWIHGTVHNPILDLAARTSTLTHSWAEENHLFDEAGARIAEDEAEELGAIMWAIVVDAFRYSKAHSDSIGEEVSLRDWFVRRLEERERDGTLGGGENAGDGDRRKKLVLQIAEMWGAFVGSGLETQSLKFFWLEECIEGENLFCASTYQKILADIAQGPITHPDCTIKFSTRAVRVISKQEDADAKVSVTTDEDEELSFDEVVVTSPLGWLQQNLDAFVPSLPERITRAINSIGYGCLEKVYISFAQPFWHRSSSPADDAGPTDDVSGFTQWLSPTYSSANPQRWTLQAAELASLPGATAHPTLLFYIYGAQSRHISDELARLAPSTAAARADWLVRYLTPYFNRLPGYAPDAAACRIVSAHFTDWLADDLAGNGSYSNFQTVVPPSATSSTSSSSHLDGSRGSNTTTTSSPPQALDRDIEALRHGLPERGVWFAGEHTSPFAALGTVTGAWWSGEAVGRRIVRAWRGLDAALGPGEAEGVVEAEAITSTGRDEGAPAAAVLPDKEVNVRGFADSALER